MPEEDGTARSLDTAYVWSFFAQMAAMALAFTGFVSWVNSKSLNWAFWLFLTGAISSTICIVGRWYIKRWFRRHRPLI